MKRRDLMSRLDEADRKGVWAFTPATFAALFGNPAPNYLKLMMSAWPIKACSRGPRVPSM
jgi:hypothetical protein